MPNDTPVPSSFSPGRRWTIGLNVLLSVLALTAIVLMANYLAARHFRQFHWSSANPYSLSPVTLRVLGSLTNEVKVIVFFDRKKPLYNSIRELLHEYELRSSKLKVEYVDYGLSRTRAEKILGDYKLTVEQDPDRVIFDGNGRTKMVYARDLSEYDYKAMLRGEEIKRGFKGEQLFTSAIYGVIDPRPAAAYFAEGHGEHDPGEPGLSGYLEFTQVLEENNITVKRLNPYALMTNDVPADCQLLVIAGPQHPFLPVELDKIEKYLNQGGRLFALFNNPLPPIGTGLEKLLANWGVEVGRNLVYDPSQNKTGEPQIVINDFGPHPVVAPLRSSRLMLIQPRSIRPRTALSQSADAPKVIELVSTGEEGVTLTPPRSRPEASGRPIPLMVAVEKGTIQGLSADRGATRMIVAGDSIFLKNGFIKLEANRDFLRNATHWLLNREILLEGIGPRAMKAFTVTITPREMRTLRWLLLAGFPGVVLFFGWLVWLRRRS